MTDENKAPIMTTPQAAKNLADNPDATVSPQPEPAPKVKAIPPQVAAAVLLDYCGDYMPDGPKIAAIRKHTLHEGKARPSTIVAGFRAALEAIRDGKNTEKTFTEGDK